MIKKKKHLMFQAHFPFNNVLIQCKAFLFLVGCFKSKIYKNNRQNFCTFGVLVNLLISNKGKQREEKASESILMQRN